MGIPFLKNFRRGFATNSSSSHSFVYMKEDQGLGVENPSSYIDSSFNWEDFSLNTIREKLFYVLVGRIGGGWDDTDPEEKYEELGDEFSELTRDDFAAAVQGNIDHQSLGTIGTLEARDPKVVVFGGNDNDGTSDERIRAIRSGEVDWSRTEIDYDDLEHIRMDDEAGQLAVRAYLDANPWAAR